MGKLQVVFDRHFAVIATMHPVFFPDDVGGQTNKERTCRDPFP